MQQAPTIPAPNQEFAQTPSEERVQRAVMALTANGFKVLIVDNGHEAKQKVLELIPPGSEVINAISTTAIQIGLLKEVNESGRYDAIAPKTAKMDRKTQGREIRKLGAAPDFIFGSVHAVTEDGHLVAGSGSGSQLGPYATGAGKVVLVVGMQKIVKDISTALRRLDEYVFPLENERMKSLGYPGANLRKILIVNKDTPERTTVILVREKLGF